MRYSKYYHHQHANGKSSWHIEWCTKYRYKVFNTLYNKNLCKIALQEAAKRSSVEILEIEIEPEHLHIIVEIPLTKTCVNAIRDLKNMVQNIFLLLSSHWD